MSKITRFFLLIVLLVTTENLFAEKRSLQDLFDGRTGTSMTRGDDVVIVNIEEWQNEYSTTLTVHGGRKYRFVNGTLKRAVGFTDGPLLRIIEGCEVELSETATLSACGVSSEALVEVADASFLVNGGMMDNSNKSFTAVNLVSVTGGNFVLKDGCLIKGHIHNNVSGNSNKVSLSGVFESLTTASDVILSGEKLSEKVSILLNGNSVIHLTSSLSAQVFLTFPETDRILVMKGDNYQLTSQDVNMVQNDAQRMEKQYHFSISDNSIYVELLKNPVVNGEFTYNVQLNDDEEVAMKFKVIDEAAKTCQVGLGNGPSINTQTTGVVYIPSVANGYTVLKIANRAFKGCAKLLTVYIPNSVTDIGNTSFESAMGAFHGCEGLTHVTIPSSVTVVGRGTFSGCHGLTSLTIPQNVIVLGSNAFDGCKNLINVRLSSNIKTIELETFRGCTSLPLIEIPGSVGSIVTNAFQNCTSLKTVISKIATPFTIPESAFTNYSATLVVPEGTVDNYKATSSWKKFYKITDNPGEADSQKPSNGPSLQNLFDDLASSGGYTGTPKTPLSVTTSPDVDIDADTSVKPDLHLLFDADQADNKQDNSMTDGIDDSYYTWHFINGSLFIKENASVRYRNIVFNSSNDESRIDVYGTLVIDANVFFHHFNKHIRVFKGGKVIWLNENTSITDDVIANEGGTVSFSEVSNLGDANGDGIVNAADIVEVVNYIKGTPSAVFIKTLADMDGNGEVDATDLRLIINIIMGEIGETGL